MFALEVVRLKVTADVTVEICSGDLFIDVIAAAKPYKAIPTSFVLKSLGGQTHSVRVDLGVRILPQLPNFYPRWNRLR